MAKRTPTAVSVPDSLDTRMLTHGGSDVALHRLRDGDAGSVAGQPVAVRDFTRFVALHRYNPFWICPGFGESMKDFAKIGAGRTGHEREVLFILAERRDGRFAVVLPMVDADLRTVLRTNETGVEFAFTGRASKADALVLVTGVGDDPYTLVRDAVAAAAAATRSFRPRDEKQVPQFVEYLGWCTWDAFYKEVDAEKVVAGLESFRAGGLVPKFLLLDDGWQDTRDARLVSVQAHREKFPQGLGGLIAQCKREFGVEIFGVWQTLMGYWNAFDPDGEIARTYRLESNNNPVDDPSKQTYLVHRDDVSRFYQDFYAHLRAQGVDMAKVDNQNTLLGHSASGEISIANMRAYQWAMQGAALTHLRGNLLHCMCNDNAVAYHMAGSTVWRNSDDYFPKRPESHGFHVHSNGLCALWTSAFSLPDWDMFQTAHEAGPFHAAARAVSGGPIYVSDKPEAHDFDLLRKLVTSDGRVLRCNGPALPTRDALFTDAAKTPQLFKVFNYSGGEAKVGVIGVFHCHWNGDATPSIRGALSPSDVEGIEGRQFAVYLHAAGSVVTLKRSQRHKLELPPRGWEIATVSPIIDGLAPLGLLDKLNGAAAIERIIRDRGGIEITLRDGGRVGVYCDRKPKAVTVNGRPSKRFTYDRATGLLTVACPVGKPCTLAVRRAGGR